MNAMMVKRIFLGLAIAFVVFFFPGYLMARFVPPHKLAGLGGKPLLEYCLLFNPQLVYWEDEELVGDNAVHVAAFNGSPDILKTLVEVGCEVNHPAPRDLYPIHAAAYNGPRCVRILIEAGSEPNVMDYDRAIPLHRAAESGEPETAVELLKAVSYINVPNREGKTPLDLAIENDNEETAELLREYGGVKGERVLQKAKSMSPKALSDKQRELLWGPVDHWSEESSADEDNE